MIKQILDLLMMQEHLGKGENIEIAKGKNELPSTFKGFIKQIKRQAQWHKSISLK